VLNAVSLLLMLASAVLALTFMGGGSVRGKETNSPR
jgi:hypothetical protein